MPTPIDQVKDHVWPNFQWSIKPQCCDLLIGAIEEQWIYVSNFTDNGLNSFYMMPVATDGHYARGSGVTISHCPFCGVKIAGRKYYASSGD